ncbi:MAG: PIN domain-containing protein [Anaerolineales bacterium]
MSTFVLDTSAVITILNQEDGWDLVYPLFDESKKNQAVLYLPFMVLMELEYLLLRKVSAEETMVIMSMVISWPIQIAESSSEWRHQAAMIKSDTALSVADAWIASLAQLHSAELVHKDPEYEQISNLRLLTLPYK